MPPGTYGEAPAYCFPLTEICMYVLFILCLFYALRRGIKDISYLVAGVLFGLLLEYVDVVSNMGYVYGKFGVMLGKPPLDVPLCIGIGWGIIMYTARLFTDTFRLPLWACACLDALLALSIDVSMDTVAYRLHMWNWDWSGTGINPLKGQWFGIPYANFSGWLYVVFFYSSISRLLERWLTKSQKAVRLKFAIIPFLSVLTSQIALYGTMVYLGGFLRNHGITDGVRLSCTLVILAVVILFGWRKRQSPLSLSVPYITWLVPAWFHVYFFIWLFIAGFYKETAWLVAAGTGSLIIGMAMHFRFKKVVKAVQVKLSNDREITGNLKRQIK